MVLAIASLCACRVETPGSDPDPDPTPDPTPTPTVSPTPTPTPTVSPTPTPTPTPSAAALTQQVVATNAGIMQAATADSQTQAAVLRSALVADTSNDATLNSAESALVTSQTAYLHAETSLYYDEDSSKVAKDAPRAAAFDEVATKLDKTARHSPTKRASSAQSTASETEDLQEELTQLAKAWDSSDATNFRNRVFLPSPDDSVARIFQGVIALTESVLPDEIAQSSEPLSLERINGRLFVVKNLYDGKYVGLNGEFYDGPGLKHLIERKDTEAAAEIGATIDKAISLAPTAENGGALNAEELQSTLEALTKQLASAAKSLGYKVKRGLR